ncbi:hypothetical protein HDV63DRAFT_397281 [Trichoderma sp. SZMC 28014]
MMSILWLALSLVSANASPVLEQRADNTAIVNLAAPRGPSKHAASGFIYDNTNASSVWPGDNGKWDDYDNFVNQLLNDLYTNNAINGTNYEIWNEPDISIFWKGKGGMQQWIDLYVRTHKIIRSDSRFNNMKIVGPSLANRPQATNVWWTEWLRQVTGNNTIPDQYTYHLEGSETDTTNDPSFTNTSLSALLSTYNTPQRQVNVNEYAQYKEMVPGSYIWWIAGLERFDFIGLLGNWQSGTVLHDLFADLIKPAAKKANPQNYTATDYAPAPGYWVYRYYATNMTGNRATIERSGDTHLDVYATIGQDRVRLIVGTKLQSGTWYLKQTGRYDCFKLKWHPIYDDKSMWPVPYHLFWDSDVAKWIESACYFLQREYDASIDLTVRELVDMIRGAQQPDGYINVHYTVVEPQKRWSNLRDMHELYNAGHLIEAALAHHKYYQNNRLLDPVLKYVSLIHCTFGSSQAQLHAYPGHPEIELALLRLYSATKSQEAYEVAQYFLQERGNPSGQHGMHYFDWEALQRKENPYTRPNTYPERDSHWYCQAHKPILEQETIEGHSVRAVYLLAAVADMVRLHHKGDKALSNHDAWAEAVSRLWTNMVNKKMYVTGGIGAIKQWEGFGCDYFLPTGTNEGGCYAETCASIGVMMLADRLLSFDLDSKYSDIMELCLYNNIMNAMSLDGKQFTYVNQLASSDTDKSIRKDWFWCACCPPNLTRLFGSLGGYVWHVQESEAEVAINIHLYTSASLSYTTASLETVTLQQISNWPWDGRVALELSSQSRSVTIRLRLPSWSHGQFELTPNPTSDDISIDKGYLSLHPSYTVINRKFSITIGGFEPRYISPHLYTAQNVLGIARGPIVYCMEDVDNPWQHNHFRDVALKKSEPISEEAKSMTNKEGYVELRTKCWLTNEEISARTAGPMFDASIGGDKLEKSAIFIPYFLRANRGGNGEMRVLLRRGGE